MDQIQNPSATFYLIKRRSEVRDMENLPPLIIGQQVAINTPNKFPEIVTGYVRDVVNKKMIPKLSEQIQTGQLIHAQAHLSNILELYRDPAYKIPKEIRTANQMREIPMVKLEIHHLDHYRTD